MLPSESPAARASDRVDDQTLSTLTGVRSGKRSYYVELRRTEERMTAAVHTLEGISAALVATRDDPRGLLLEVLHAASGHLHSDWTMIALRDSAWSGLDARFVALGPGGRIVENEQSLPSTLRAELRPAHRTRSPDRGRPGWVRVPLMLNGDVLGQLIGAHPPDETVEHEDLWVLQILANQAATAIHTASMYATATALRQEAQDLYDGMIRSSRDLADRTEELERAQGRLQVLHQRELLDAERHRIALELHDSVAQYVLSAGLAVEVCRAEAAERGRSSGAAVERLTHARNLIADAGDQVRSVIYALHHEPAGDEVASLPDLLHDLAAQYRPTLSVSVRIEGRPVHLSGRDEHALARIAGEALFNASIHASASRALVRLRYGTEDLSLSVSDDGTGDPRHLRTMLRLEAAGTADGRHRGLANMARRAEDLGGEFRIRRASIGGVRIEVQTPVPEEVP